MRDFEQEYKNYINEDIPDLWNRIEPNLKAKIPVVNPVDDRFVQNNQPNAFATQANDAKTVSMSAMQQKRQQGMNNKHSDKKKKNLNRFFKAAIPVAAALCLLLIGGNVILLSQKSSDTTASEATADSSSEHASHNKAEHFAAAESAAEATSDEAAYDYDEMDDAVATEDVTDQTPSDAEDVNAGDASETSKDTNDSGNAIGRVRETFEGVTCIADELSASSAYVSVYTFALTDGSKIKCYVTKELADQLAADGFAIQVDAIYDIEVERLDAGPMQGGKKAALGATEAYVLKTITAK